jgi:hypothetical protein
LDQHPGLTVAPAALTVAVLMVMLMVMLVVMLVVMVVAAVTGAWIVQHAQGFGACLGQLKEMEPGGGAEVFRLQFSGGIGGDGYFHGECLNARMQECENDR